jgi:hypothetical protein
MALSPEISVCNQKTAANPTKRSDELPPNKTMDRKNAKSSGEKAVVRSVGAGADGNQGDEIMKVIPVPRNEHQKCRERPQVWQLFQLRARALLQRGNPLRARHRLHEWCVKHQSY